MNCKYVDFVYHSVVATPTIVYVPQCPRSDFLQINIVPQKETTLDLQLPASFQFIFFFLFHSHKKQKRPGVTEAQSTKLFLEETGGSKGKQMRALP